MSLLYANDQPGAYPPSYYAATAAPPKQRPALVGEARVDVAVVGAGYTGLSAALHLSERGYKVAVLEAHRVGWGASGRNGGQVSGGQRIDQEELEGMVGASDARRLWDLGNAARNLVDDLIARCAIACERKFGLIHMVRRASETRELHAHVEYMASRYDHRLRVVEGDEARAAVASPDYVAGLIDDAGGHLHPLKYALGLAAAAEAAGASIYEGTEALRIAPGDPAVLTTAEGRLTASHVILACNGYLGDLAPKVASRVMPINNFILATEPLGEEAAAALIAENRAVADSRFVVNYFRLSADHRLLFGGGETYGYRFPADIKAFVRRPMLKVFPQLAQTRIDYGWGGTLAITMSRLPHFARLGGGVLCASGYSGHGVAMASLAGQIAAEAVAGQAERFDTFAAAPTAPFPGGARLRAPLLALAMFWYGLRDRL